MKILGLTIDVPTCSSAVLLDGGEIVCGSPEERLNREKQSMKFPSQSISFCLKHNKTDIADLDAVAISWNPLINVIESTSSRLTSSNRHRGEMLYTVLANLEPFLKEKPRFMKQSIELGAKSLDIYYLNHHDCHAANAYYESGYREAVILTCDGYGENETASVSIGKDNVIERKSATLFPNSLGMFYGTITEYLGFRHDSDEWKVMALGAYGTFDKRLHGKLEKLFSVEDDFTIRVNTNVFQFNNSLTRGMYNQDLVEYLGVQPRGRNEPLLAEHYNLALATQKIFEEILFEWCRKIHGKFGVDNLCLGGGSFMNSVFNGKIAESGIFGNVYIPFAPNDAGGAIGAAYHLYFDVLKNERNGRAGVASPYIGPSYDDDQVEKTLRLFKSKYRKEENIGRTAARLIADGMIVGWFQGAMEFGERALGNRSILADPRNPDSKTKVNAVIKFREQFRPFAPSVLEEHAHEYFVLPRNGGRTPYMEKVFPIRKEKAPLIPSVTHADGTGRLQTVSRASNPKYYDMIREFHSITGIPIVVNTSLNRNGEPIVCSPEDALAVFYGSGLDYMVLHDYLVEK